MSTIDHDNRIANLLDIIRKQEQQIEYLSKRVDSRDPKRNLFCLTVGGPTDFTPSEGNEGYQWLSPTWVPHDTVRVVRVTSSLYSGNADLWSYVFDWSPQWSIETATAAGTSWTQEGPITTHKCDFVVPPSSHIKVLGSIDSLQLQLAYAQIWMEGESGGGHLPLFYGPETIEV